jgi:hypothetical protein
MSGVVDSGREIGHGNINANDPKETWVGQLRRDALADLDL